MENTKTLHAFGDSNIVGDQDDFYGEANTDPNNPPTHGMEYSERVEYLKYNVSFVSILAKKLGVQLKNYAECGTGNFPQLDRLAINLINNNIKKGDLVLFGMTTPLRDRVRLIENNIARDRQVGPWLVDRETLINDSILVYRLDYLYILGLLNHFSEKFQVRIIRFHLFDNLKITWGSDDNIDPGIALHNPRDYLGYNIPGNTLIDILNDTWGRHSYRKAGKIDVLPGYKHLYTFKNHPSIAGHEKLANWFLNKVDLNARI
jgi:hypothetical protein